jgi:hypothetical protein
LLLWCLQAKGPTAYANNAAFVQEYVCSLLASSFPNMTPVQIQAAVAGMMAIEEKRAFKHHMRDFLVQVRGWPLCVAMCWRITAHRGCAHLALACLRYTTEQVCVA